MTSTPTTSRPSTIRDVASRAGVAISTVSIVFGGTRSAVKISEATQKRVRSAADAVGYHPNATARALRRRSTRNIGLIIADEMPGLAPDLAAALKITHIEDRRRLCGAGYTLQVMRHRADQPAPTLSAIASRAVDGLIFSGLVSERLLELCARLKVPCIDVAGTLGRMPVCAVEADLVTARCTAVRYAYGLGHRRVAIAISAGEQQHHLYDAVAARVAKDPGLADCRLTRFELPPLSLVPDGRPLLSLWQAKPAGERPTLVMAAESTLMAFLVELSNAGVRCPADVNLIGLSRCYVSDMVVPRLTAIENAVQPACVSAINLLIDHVESGRALGREDSPPLLSCDFIVRDSCAPI